MECAMTEPKNQPAAETAPSDAELLRAIARKRDRAAFEELYARHQDRAFALLCAILHDPNDAQDALQNTFVRVWSGAHSVKHFDRIPAWILRVAAREGVRVIASRKQKKRRNVSLDTAMETGAQPVAREAALPEEVVAALRAQVGALDPGQRSVVALYFGGNLSQQEIAEALSLSQQSVSHRLNQALEHLRIGLRQAGFAAALPLLETNALPAALTSGHAAPSSAWAGIGSKLSTAAEASQRVAAAKGPSALIWLGAAVVLVAGAAGWWAVRQQVQPPASARSATPPPPDDKTEDAAGAGLPAASPFHKTWTFENGLPSDMEIVYGRWQLVDNKGHRMLGPLFKELTLIKLPMKVEARYYRVRIKIWPNPKAVADPTAGSALTLFPTRAGKLGEFTRWHRILLNLKGENVNEFWLLNGCVVNLMSGNLNSLYIYDGKTTYDTFYIRTMPVQNR